MNRKLPVLMAAAGVTLTIAACGGYDPTDAVDSLNKTVNENLQAGLEAGGISSSTASKAGITIKCPDNVEKGKTFTCTATGKLTGKSTDVKMEIDDNDELTTVSGEDLGTALGPVIKAEGNELAN